MKNITAIARLFKHGDRYFTIIHGTNAMIDSVTEYVEKIAKAVREAPFNVAQHPHPLEQFACMRKARLNSFLFVDDNAIHIDMEVVRYDL